MDNARHPGKKYKRYQKVKQRECCDVKKLDSSKNSEGAHDSTDNIDPKRTPTNGEFSHGRNHNEFDTFAVSPSGGKIAQPGTTNLSKWHWLCTAPALSRFE